MPDVLASAPAVPFADPSLGRGTVNIANDLGPGWSAQSRAPPSRAALAGASGNGTDRVGTEKDGCSASSAHVPLACRTGKLNQATEIAGNGRPGGTRTPNQGVMSALL